MIAPVYALSVPAVWPLVRHWIEAAQNKGGGDRAEDVYQRCCNNPNTLLLTVLHEGDVIGVAVLEKEDTCLNCTTLAGALMPVMGDLVEEWCRVAREMGCTTISMRGRKGWNRVLQGLDFRQQDDGFMEATL